MKKLLLFSVSLLCATSLLKAQAPSHPQYVKVWGDDEAFSRLYKAWQPGQTLSKERADDEEFFISRVKPRTRFENKQTQVDVTKTTDKKLLWWVPCGISQWNAIPSYFFNSEVFSTWSYIDHWGNWTATYLRMPGAFADVAHKNGVSISCTATMPFGVDLTPYDSSWGTKMYAVAEGGAEKYVKFLKYYGMDGAGYNSEARFNSKLNSLYKNFLAEVSGEAQKEGLFNYSNVWYGITDSGGGMSNPWDALTRVHQDWFSYMGKTTSTHYFLNYNWNSGHINSSVQTAKSLSRSSYDVYAGINMQKGSGVNWSLLERSNVSIGIWGAHNANMIFENRGSAGASAIAQQEEYQKASESVFTGGKRNPLSHYSLGTSLPSGSGSAARFFGMSKMMPARSTLHGDIAEQPFVTYFNLGNGTFFNIEGDRKFDNEWYNIGMQDFMPSWRWWLSSKFLGQNESDMPVNQLDVVFTWEDAWFGGSCLQIKGGTASTQYLQLFKTEYSVKEGDEIRIRYKVVNGKGDLSLTALAKDESSEYSRSIFTSSDKVTYGEWMEVTVPIKSSGRNVLQMTGKTIAMLGLKFDNTSDDFVVRIGELSLTRGSYATPEAPIFKKAVSLDNNFRGADFKIIYSMDKNPRTDGKTTYNEDVNTWYFKIYSQQEGEEPQFCTATTSWAAYVVGAKLNSDGVRKMRYGVSAVSLDGNHESEISWSEYQELDDAKVIEGIKIDKSIVNKNEQAVVSFVDPSHPVAKSWSVKDDNGVIKSQDGGTSFNISLDKIGSYTVECLLTDGTLISKSSFVTVVPKSAGSFPEIKTLTANGKTEAIEIKPDENATIAYTSRNSDGAVSRALRLKNASFKVSNLYRDLNVRIGHSGSNAEGGITVSFWFRPEQTVFADGQDGMRMFDISKAREGWPMSEWGYFWVNYGQGHNKSGKSRPSYEGFTWTNVATGYNANNAREKILDTKRYKLEAGLWYHMTVQLDYNLASKIFINGKLVDQQSGNPSRASLFNNQFELNISKYVKFASTFDGLIDEVRIYNRFLPENDIPGLMSHLPNPSSEKSKGLKAYFDFENESSRGIIPSQVGSIKAQLSRLTWIGEGNQDWSVIEDIQYGASTAMVEGNSYPVVTSPRWSATKGQFSEQENNETSGSTKVKWQKDGVYPVTLSLENAWGTDKKTFNVVNVGASANALDEVSVIDLSVYPNPFTETLRLHFAQDGAYGLYLYDLNGNLVSQRMVDGVSGTLYTMNVNAPTGIYILKVVRNGKLVSSVKLQKK